MANLLDRTLAQFDTLVPYLGLAHKEVFGLLNREKALWFDASQQSAFPASFAVYRKQIIQSALLLGYSYFEAFLSDLMHAIYTKHPEMLPPNKQICYADIVRCADLASLHQAMAQREIHEVFYKSIDDITKYFHERLNLIWSTRHRERTLLASLIRNNIIHNSSRVDARLAAISSYEIGAEITLEAGDVHAFGLDARALIADLFSQATVKHLNRPEVEPKTSARKSKPATKTPKEPAASKPLRSRRARIASPDK